MTFYTRAWHPLAENVYAYLQPDGTWGLNNTGLIIDSGESLLIDTLFDLKLTQNMLDEMKPLTKKIDRLVITHSNGDHWYGYKLVKDAEIITTEECSKEMKKMTPGKMKLLMSISFLFGKAHKMIREMFGKFAFQGYSFIPPDLTFSGTYETKVGEKNIHLIQFGPAHTAGDLIVHLASEKIIFASDLLFIKGTPLMWTPHVENWIKALDYMLSSEADVFVPGHGPITDRQGVQLVKDYFHFLTDESKKQYDNRISVIDAACNIDLGRFADLGELERTVVNVFFLYKKFAADPKPVSPISLFKLMAEFKARKRI